MSRSTKPRSGLNTRRAVWVSIALGAIVVMVIVLAMWLRPQVEPVRARQYIEFTACMLTAEPGLLDPDAAAVWAGLQDASLATLAKVQYVAIAGPQTLDNALTFVASLAQGNCDLIFAVGELPVEATNRGAEGFPAVQFYAVGDDGGEPNVLAIRVETREEIRATVNDIVKAQVAQAGR